MSTAGHCKVCSDARVVEIDRACVVPGISLREVARRFGLDRSAVQRHAKRHVRARLQKAAKERKEGSDPDLLDELLLFVKATKHVLGRTVLAEDWTAAVQAIRAGIQAVEVKAKLLGYSEGSSSGGIVINILALPEWQMIQTKILIALEPHPEAKEAVVRALTADTRPQ